MKVFDRDVHFDAMEILSGEVESIITHDIFRKPDTKWSTSLRPFYIFVI